ncbi:MAG: B12-binding domain-containing radical SAM protein [Dissulfurispiraceae bacterium]
MKILLINPSCLAESGRDLYSAHLLGPFFTAQPNKRMALGIPLALPTLAALTPPEHTVRIIDEEIEDINFDEPADIVGITAMTFKAKRAYEIAYQFRNRGVPVVMGGIHATVCPEEVKQYVDSVVIGEAEDIWPKLLDDLSKDSWLKDFYRMETFPDLKGSQVPRYDLIKNRNYVYSYLQTTRGCPHNCEFCSVTRTSGHKLRKKLPEQVIAEVDALLALKPSRQFNAVDRVTGESKKFVGTIGFIDDNFAIDRNHALAICEALRRYQEDHGIAFIWYTQVNHMVGFDEELLTAMENSNCLHLFIGFETLDPQTLKSMKKKMNKPEAYGEAISNIHRHHMRVIFSTIIGDDNTSRESARQLQSFIEKNNVLHVLLNILTPYPGTALGERMEKEGRLLTKEPQMYNIRNIVFKHKRLSVIELEKIYLSLCNQMFSYDAVYHRGKQLLGTTDRLYLALLDRVLVLLGFVQTCFSFMLRGRVRWPIGLRLLISAPKQLLYHGSLYALELLVASVDYDDFAFSETARLSGSNQSNEGSSEQLLNLIELTMRHIPSISDLSREYKGFYVPSSLLSTCGIQTLRENAGRPLLLLGGTSIPIEDRKELIGFLLQAGYEVASIENPIGSPLDFSMRPGLDRAISLTSFLHHLRDKEGVKSVDIIGQSYSAFEIIRSLRGNPNFSSFVRSIILINPPGLNENITFLKHVSRFIFHHVIGGYLKSLGTYLGFNIVSLEGGHKVKRVYAKREAQGISTWTFKTCLNLVRTFKEVHDIVTFRIKEPLRDLQDSYGYDINVFLQSHDQIVPTRVTREALKDLVRDDHVEVVPGGHNDLFFQKWQRPAFLNFIRKVRQHKILHEQSSGVR